MEYTWLYMQIKLIWISNAEYVYREKFDQHIPQQPLKPMKYILLYMQLKLIWISIAEYVFLKD